MMKMATKTNKEIEHFWNYAFVTSEPFYFLLVQQTWLKSWVKSRSSVSSSIRHKTKCRVPLLNISCLLWSNFTLLKSYYSKTLWNFMNSAVLYTIIYPWNVLQFQANETKRNETTKINTISYTQPFSYCALKDLIWVLPWIEKIKWHSWI